MGYPPIWLQYIEVNLSVVQCVYSNLVDEFVRIMDKYGVTPSSINLEITESASVEAKNILLDNMKKLIVQFIQGANC